MFSLAQSVIEQWNLKVGSTKREADKAGFYFWRREEDGEVEVVPADRALK